MKTRTERLTEIEKLDEALQNMMADFLVAEGWRQDGKGRWQKRFNGKWRDVISVRVAFNIERLKGDAPASGDL